MIITSSQITYKLQILSEIDKYDFRSPSGQIYKESFTVSGLADRKAKYWGKQTESAYQQVALRAHHNWVYVEHNLTMICSYNNETKFS